MTTQYNKIRVNVSGLILGGQERPEVLLLQKTGGPEAGRWDLPGGKLEPGEEMAAGLAREIKEEPGLEAVDVKIEGLLTVKENFYPDWKETGMHCLSIVFMCSVTAPETQSKEVGAIRWIPVDELSRYPTTSRATAALAGMRHKNATQSLLAEYKKDDV